jgi:hypothetical protein
MCDRFVASVSVERAKRQNELIGYQPPCGRERNDDSGSGNRDF